MEILPGPADSFYESATDRDRGTDQRTEQFTDRRTGLLIKMRGYTVISCSQKAGKKKHYESNTKTVHTDGRENERTNPFIALLQRD